TGSGTDGSGRPAGSLPLLSLRRLAIQALQRVEPLLGLAVAREHALEVVAGHQTLGEPRAAEVGEHPGREAGHERARLGLAVDRLEQLGLVALRVGVARRDPVAGARAVGVGPPERRARAALGHEQRLVRVARAQAVE